MLINESDKRSVELSASQAVQPFSKFISTREIHRYISGPECSRCTRLSLPENGGARWLMQQHPSRRTSLLPPIGTVLEHQVTAQASLPIERD